MVRSTPSRLVLALRPYVRFGLVIAVWTLYLFIPLWVTAAIVVVLLTYPWLKGAYKRSTSGGGDHDAPTTTKAESTSSLDATPLR